MICPHCGAGILAGTETCPACGQETAVPVLSLSRRPWVRLGAGLGGTLLLLPLLGAAWIEWTTALRLEPLPLAVAVLLAGAGMELLLRSLGRRPEGEALQGWARIGKRNSPQPKRKDWQQAPH
ncbi:MAG: zinc ribbon domain-containing protein [Bacillota bacterium]|nr:zinc ribbon domain-containing protein [Bacillota bacterium]